MGEQTGAQPRKEENIMYKWDIAVWSSFDSNEQTSLHDCMEYCQQIQLSERWPSQVVEAINEMYSNFNLSMESFF